MKKLFAVMMALCLMLSVAAAETAVEVNWADTFGPAVEAGNVPGDFITFDEIAVKIWIPEGLQAVELSDEDKANGYIGYFTENTDNATVAVMYVDMNGLSIEDYAAKLQQIEGVTEVEMAIVNGLPAVNYRIPEKDTVSVAFATQAGYILEVTMYPLSVENANLVWGAVAASIQAAE